MLVFFKKQTDRVSISVRNVSELTSNKAVEHLISQYLLTARAITYNSNNTHSESIELIDETHVTGAREYALPISVTTLFVIVIEC